MGKMRKNMENTNGVVRVNHSELQVIKEAIANLQSKLDNVAFHVHKSTFQKAMAGPDISEFFPVKNAEMLDLFMDRQHPKWPERRDEFYHYLYTCVTETKSSFCTGLFKALFTREYMRTVKWPAFGYIILPYRIHLTSS